MSFPPDYLAFTGPWIVPLAFLSSILASAAWTRKLSLFSKSYPLKLSCKGKKVGMALTHWYGKSITISRKKSSSAGIIQRFPRNTFCNFSLQITYANVTAYTGYVDECDRAARSLYQNITISLWLIMVPTCTSNKCKRNNTIRRCWRDDSQRRFSGNNVATLSP